MIDNAQPLAIYEGSWIPSGWFYQTTFTQTIFWKMSKSYTLQYIHPEGNLL